MSAFGGQAVDPHHERRHYRAAHNERGPGRSTSPCRRSDTAASPGPANARCSQADPAVGRERGFQSGVARVGRLGARETDQTVLRCAAMERAFAEMVEERLRRAGVKRREACADAEAAKTPLPCGARTPGAQKAASASAVQPGTARPSGHALGTFAAHPKGHVRSQGSLFVPCDNEV